MTHPPSRAVGLIYLIFSILYGTLFTRLPEIQAFLQIDQNQIGIALLAMSIGAFLFTPTTSWLLSHWSMGKTLILGMTLLSVAFVIPSITTSYSLFAISMLILGMTNGWINVGVNAAATGVEKKYGVNIMTTCHGMYSIGGVIGAISAGVIASLNVPLSFHLLGIIVIVFIFLLSFKDVINQLPNESRSGPLFALPGRPLLKLSLIALLIVLTEVAIMDWCSIYLRNDMKTNAFITGLGFAGFSFSMAIGRLQGDQLRETWGNKKILLIGIPVALFGICLAAFSSWVSLVILGFTLAGLGFSCSVPLLYASSVKAEGVSPAMGVAAIATAGIIGIIIGRPGMGFIAEQWNLATGFGILAILTVFAFIVIWRTEF